MTATEDFMVGAIRELSRLETKLKQDLAMAEETKVRSTRLRGFACALGRHTPVAVAVGHIDGRLVIRDECSRRGCKAYWLSENFGPRVRM